MSPAKLLFLFIVCYTFKCSAQDFLQNQLRYSTVRNARANSETYWMDVFEQANISYPPNQLYLRAFKSEGLLEVWATNDSIFKKITNLSICAKSGHLGPKSRQGDLQVPEGEYYIDRFNPSSNFLLSLGINYPNNSDRIRSNAKQLGEDIFIHGSCVTVGCLPLTDPIIERLYWLCAITKNKHNKKIRVSIYPFQLYQLDYRTHLVASKHQSFWANLKTGYDLFNVAQKLPSYTIDSTNGAYVYKINRE